MLCLIRPVTANGAPPNHLTHGPPLLLSKFMQRIYQLLDKLLYLLDASRKIISLPRFLDLASPMELL